MKNLYLVMVVDRLKINFQGHEIKPEVPKGIAGYCPVYTNKRMAMKDWPKREILKIQKSK